MPINAGYPPQQGMPGVNRNFNQPGFPAQPGQYPQQQQAGEYILR